MSKAKRKGTAAESAVVQYLRDHGFPYAERRALAGAKDLGDITGIPSVVVEVKNHAALDLGGWMRELQQEMDNANVDVGVLVVKRLGKGSPADWYWITAGDVMTTLLTAYVEAE